MSFRIDRETLLGLIETAAATAEKKPSRPILSHVLMQYAEGPGVLLLRATDLVESLECSATVSYGDGEKTSFDACVNVFDLLQIVKGLPKDCEVAVAVGEWEKETSVTTLNGKEKKTTVLQGKDLVVSVGTKIKFKLPCLPADEFPELPAPEYSVEFNMPASLFTDLIDRCFFAVATDETRYYLGGVYLTSLEGFSLRAVATDGHILGLAEGCQPEGIAAPLEGYILPRNAITHVKKMLKGEGEVEVSFGGGRVAFRAGDTLLSTMLVEGNFPDYQQVIPKESPIMVKADRMELIDALKRVSTISADKSWGVKCAFAGEELSISSQAVGKGEGKQTIEISAASAPVEIGFNAKYLISALSAFSTDSVWLGLTDTLSPCVITPDLDDSKEIPADEVQHQQAVIMPMRI